MVSDRLADALVRFAATLVSDFVAERALDDLMQFVPPELGVDGAGVMLHDDEGELRFVAASDETVRLIERFQVETGEGPCVEAARTGTLVQSPDLRDGDDRYPRFAPMAADAGLVSVHSVPMLVEDERIGAMNLYRRTPGGLSEGEQRAGVVVADMSAAYLIAARRADEATRMLERLRLAMDRNAPIEQAKGFLAHALGMDPVEAYELIRGRARSERVRSLDIAEQVMAGRLKPDELVSWSADGG